jgi:uncharacterized damage-inducible protein DinB
MYQTGNDFLQHYGWESGITQNAMNALTDESLSMSKGEGQHDLRQLAWHVATSFGYMTQAGWDLPEYTYEAPAGLTAKQIQDKFAEFTARVNEIAAGKTGEDMAQVHRLFDTQDWSLSQALGIIISHEIHHRGQMTVLMRLAGLTVPNIYGPNYEDTQAMMAKMAEEQQG